MFYMNLCSENVDVSSAEKRADFTKILTRIGGDDDEENKKI